MQWMSISLPHLVFVAVGWRCEPVWHQVHQTDPSGQSRWYLAQPQRWARLCRKIQLIYFMKPFSYLIFRNAPFNLTLCCFCRVLPMWPRRSWKVWRKVSLLSPGLDPFAVTTAAHARPSGKSQRLLMTSGRFCPSTTAAKTWQPLVKHSLQHMSIKACDSCCLFGPRYFGRADPMSPFQPSEFFGSWSLQGLRQRGFWARLASFPSTTDTARKRSRQPADQDSRKG